MDMIEWMRAGLAKPGRSQAELARLMKLDKSAISKVTKGKRQLKAHEMVIASRYFGEEPPAPLIPTSPGEASSEVHHLLAALGSLVDAKEYREAARIARLLAARLSNGTADPDPE